jgi:peptidoglycan-N-acetylglucosamine deacetylase
VTVAVQSGGMTYAEKTQRYWVQNSSSDKMRQITGPEADRLTSILWNRMRIKPSLTIAYYFAAKYHLAKGSVRDATAFLEKTAACDPDYADTRALLARCYGQSGYKQVTSGPKGSKVVALTFDDGPNATTPNVLDILAANDVKATFFVVGSQVECNPSIVKTMSEQGHQIESHTFSHRNIQRLPRKDVERELMKAAAAIRDSTGKESRFFRPPGGHAGADAEAAAADYGLTGVFWTVACSKFEGSNPESMVQHVLTSIDDGGILLLHNGEEVTLKALPVIIAELRNRGYRFATLSELMGGR